MSKVNDVLPTVSPQTPDEYYAQWVDREGINAEKVRDDSLTAIQRAYDRSSATYGATAEMLRQSGLNNSGLAGLYQNMAETNRRQGNATVYDQYAANVKSNKSRFAAHNQEIQGKIYEQAMTMPEATMQDLQAIAAMYGVDPITAQQMAQSAWDSTTDIRERGLQAKYTDTYNQASDFVRSFASQGLEIDAESIATRYPNLSADDVQGIIANEKMRYSDVYAAKYIATMDIGFVDVKSDKFNQMVKDFASKYGISEESARTALEKEANKTKMGANIIWDLYESGDYFFRSPDDVEMALLKEEYDHDFTSEEIRIIYNNYVDKYTANLKEAEKEEKDPQTLEDKYNSAKEAGDINLQNEIGGQIVSEAMRDIVKGVGKDDDGETVFDLLGMIGDGTINDGFEGAKTEQYSTVIGQMSFNVNGIHTTGVYSNSIGITASLGEKDYSMQLSLHTNSSKYSDTLSKEYPSAKNGDFGVAVDGEGRHLSVFYNGSWYWIKKEGATSNGDSITDGEWKLLWEGLVETNRNHKGNVTVDDGSGVFENVYSNIPTEDQGPQSVEYYYQPSTDYQVMEEFLKKKSPPTAANPSGLPAMNDEVKKAYKNLTIEEKKKLGFTEAEIKALDAALGIS